MTNGGVRKFHLGDVAQGVWGRKSPSRVGGLRDTEAEAVCRHYLQILTAATIKNRTE